MTYPDCNNGSTIVPTPAPPTIVPTAPSPVTAVPTPAPTLPPVCGNNVTETNEECEGGKIIIISDMTYFTSKIGENEICGLDCQLNDAHCCFRNASASVSDSSLILLNRTQTMQNLVSLCIERLAIQVKLPNIFNPNEVKFTFGNAASPTCPFCGNGIIDSVINEQCDNGTILNRFNTVCASNCIINPLQCCARGQLKTITDIFNLNVNPQLSAEQYCVKAFNSSNIKISK